MLKTCFIVLTMYNGNGQNITNVNRVIEIYETKTFTFVVTDKSHTKVNEKPLDIYKQISACGYLTNKQ